MPLNTSAPSPGQQTMPLSRSLHVSVGQETSASGSSSVPVQQEMPPSNDPVQSEIVGSPPKMLLSGINLARVLDAIEHTFPFMQSIFDLDSYANSSSGAECARLREELRLRIAPQIDVLFDENADHMKKERVWKPIGDRLGFTNTNPHRFRRLIPHKHYSLHETVKSLLDKRRKASGRKPCQYEHGSSSWDQGFPSFEIKGSETPEGWFFGNKVNSALSYPLTTTRKEKIAIGETTKGLYHPLHGWLRHHVPGRIDSCPWRRPCHMDLEIDESSSSGSGPSSYSLSARAIRRPQNHEVHWPTRPGFEDVPLPDVRACAVCKIIFRANVLVGEVEMGFWRGRWNTSYREELPYIVRDMIDEDWERVNAVYKAEHDRNYHPADYLRYELPKVYEFSQYLSLDRANEMSARSVFDFITERVVEAGLRPTPAEPFDEKIVPGDEWPWQKTFGPRPFWEVQNSR
ncbi:hypothetical protein Daesc_002792 [Daldinia eschscholtzii]|uniref:Uncharacterized protein n=1 Tax=Daldinia eschscholtzii TaxID=292717 RepID=A0AAX6MSK4_9PEZI